MSHYNKAIDIDSEHVTFETAKLAASKLFNEFSFAVYRSDDKTIYLHKAKSGSRKNHLELINNCVLANARIAKYSAPTQAILQQWLIVAHNINVDVIFNGAQYTFNIWVDNKLHSSSILSTETKYFDKRRNALETGLSQALQLIAIDTF
jgi:hypothetical protein